MPPALVRKDDQIGGARATPYVNHKGNTCLVPNSSTVIEDPQLLQEVNSLGVYNVSDMFVHIVSRGFRLFAFDNLKSVSLETNLVFSSSYIVYVYNLGDKIAALISCRT